MEARVWVVVMVVLAASVMVTLVDSQKINKISKRSNKFALNMFQALSRSRYGDNVFFSPISISTALAMVHLGARGNTSSQMTKVMQLKGLDEEDIHASFHQLNSMLYGPGNLYTLKSANQLFGQAGYPFLQEFLQATDDYYNARLEAVDFARQTEDSRLLINDWVENQTEGKIKDLITPGALDPMTVLVLVNAIYFKGSWASRFKVEDTKPGEFFIDKDQTTEVTMMHQKGKFNFHYDPDLNLDVLEMPYNGSKISMVVILPREIDGLDQVESRLDPDLLKLWAEKMINSTVVVSMPKFKITQSFVLNDQLSAMGMRDLFRAGVADLTGISRDSQLYISKVIHKSFVEVNEEGTEAAAATAAVIRSRMMQVEPEFNANHPFLFLIRDNRSGAILFMGRYSHPPTNGNSREEL